MIIDQEILDKAAAEYEDDSHYPCGELEGKERAFKAGARWAEERIMRFVPWDYDMPEEVKQTPLIPEEMCQTTKYDRWYYLSLMTNDEFPGLNLSSFEVAI